MFHPLPGVIVPQSAACTHVACFLTPVKGWYGGKSTLVRRIVWLQKAHPFSGCHLVFRNANANANANARLVLFKNAPRTLDCGCVSEAAGGPGQQRLNSRPRHRAPRARLSPDPFADGRSLALPAAIKTAFTPRTLAKTQRRDVY